LHHEQGYKRDGATEEGRDRHRCRRHTGNAVFPGFRIQELAAKARGILVFPKIYAAGLGFGGEYGEGALKVDGASVGYYRTSSVTWGFQAGAQSKALIMMFMTQEALDKFRNSSSGWTAGADASVAVIKTGAQGTGRPRECHCSRECLRAHQCGAHGRGDH
jgi:lipid-binding SYLF domain-containing protein